MAKLYFRYGAMNSGKTTALMQVAYNYEERGMRVFILKPSIDTKGGECLLSRLGVSRPVDKAVTPDMDVFQLVQEEAGRGDKPLACVLTDESQFFTPEQIDELRRLVDERDLPVLCFGLRTDFLTHFFPGSRRLMELADSITEIKTVCECGSKATVNARIGPDGRIITAGDQIFLGGNDSYVAMCHKCWRRKIKEQQGE